MNKPVRFLLVLILLAGIVTVAATRSQTAWASAPQAAHQDQNPAGLAQAGSCKEWQVLVDAWKTAKDAEDALTVAKKNAATQPEASAAAQTAWIAAWKLLNQAQRTIKATTGSYEGTENGEATEAALKTCQDLAAQATKQGTVPVLGEPITLGQGTYGTVGGLARVTAHLGVGETVTTSLSPQAAGYESKTVTLAFSGGGSATLCFAAPKGNEKIYNLTTGAELPITYTTSPAQVCAVIASPGGSFALGPFDMCGNGGHRPDGSCTFPPDPQDNSSRVGID